MPRRPDDDDAPRWEPPAPSTEAPTWESSSEDRIPRWDPEADVPRWEPDAQAPRWTPPPAAAAPRARVEPPTLAVKAAPVRRWARLARPFVWWHEHPWIVVWALIPAIPLVAVALRLLDESAHAALVGPTAWAFGALLVAALAVAGAARARRSPVRLALGLAGALAAAGLLLWPVTRVTLGRAPCPLRAGPDLGAPIAASALEAWRAGASGDAAWRGGRADPAWTQRARSAGLIDFSLEETGCWERIAPVDGTRTWHEFRATIRAGADNPLSKVVVVHTARGDEGWKITAVEGPLP
jgi:hypothetical protein